MAETACNARFLHCACSGGEFSRMDVPSVIAQINEHLYGTDSFSDLLLWQFEALQRLLAKYPKTFRNTDGAVWRHGRGHRPASRRNRPWPLTPP